MGQDSFGVDVDQIFSWWNWYCRTCAFRLVITHHDSTNTYASTMQLKVRPSHYIRLGRGGFFFSIRVSVPFWTNLSTTQVSVQSGAWCSISVTIPNVSLHHISNSFRPKKGEQVVIDIISPSPAPTREPAEVVTATKPAGGRKESVLPDRKEVLLSVATKKISAFFFSLLLPAFGRYVLTF